MLSWKLLEYSVLTFSFWLHLKSNLDIEQRKRSCYSDSKDVYKAFQKLSVAAGVVQFQQQSIFLTKPEFAKIKFLFKASQTICV